MQRHLIWTWLVCHLTSHAGFKHTQLESELSFKQFNTSSNCTYHNMTETPNRLTKSVALSERFSSKIYCFINACRWPRSTVPFHKQFASILTELFAHFPFAYMDMYMYACDRCRCRIRIRYIHISTDTDTVVGVPKTIYGHMRWQTTMRHISNYINVYLKNYTSDLQERPSMTSGQIHDSLRYIHIHKCI